MPQALRPEPPIRSLWSATAVPAQTFAPLAGEVQADVAIVGGGYTGLSAALHCAADGLQPIVLEANSLGWGASGRNGGVVSAKFRLSFAEAAAAHGMDVARRMYAIAHEAVDLLEELVDRHGMAPAHYRRVGQVKGAHNAVSLAGAVADLEWMRAEMGDRAVTALSRAEVAAETGSNGFVGGVRSPHAGAIHPLNYLRGLVAAADAAGVRLHEGTPALRMRREGDGIVVETPDGVVRAKTAILATNGYSDRTAASEPLRRKIIPFRSAMIATAPLSANLAGAVMPTRRVYVETRRMMRWFRMVDDRVIFGGRGAFGTADSESAFRVLQAAMVRTFPALADTAVEHRWSGLVAMTLDGLPHLGRIDDRVLFAAGYNGSGVAMSTLLGKYCAALVRGETPDLALLDASRFRTVPFYPLREAGVRLVAGWYQFMDSIGR
ncbi:NAD(P)/FAD-dependent oxidoreductase [Lichenifustis flavocetrariae]|uniref:FAD-binding oxidoreductase n=1 Tax=Lichenifustis flavocetrariae TaxID=2949735 RepID=A0AA41Z420_9HYPH|nr:FAD-binding oxidoreductase [Lichenifustis flavocetrariae]MCW6512682.1 FAD-binding oxidoreductase [Lichenifustis flavocetrariae]